MQLLPHNNQKNVNKMANLWKSLVHRITIEKQKPEFRKKYNLLDKTSKTITKKSSKKLTSNKLLQIKSNEINLKIRSSVLKQKELDELLLTN